MSKQNSQIDEATQWMSEAKEALIDWGGYYRAGFSALIPHDSVIGRAHSGHIQQPINANRIEAATKNDATDAIVSALPESLRWSIIEVYGMRYSLRHAAERRGMNIRAFRDTLQMAQGGVAVGLSLLGEDYQDGVRTKPLARTRAA